MRKPRRYITKLGLDTFGDDLRDDDPEALDQLDSDYIKRYPNTSRWTDENGNPRSDIIKMFEEAQPITHEKASHFAKQLDVSLQSVIAKVRSLGFTYLTKAQEKAELNKGQGVSRDFEAEIADFMKGQDNG